MTPNCCNYFDGGNLINRVRMWILSQLYIRVNVGCGILLAIITVSSSSAKPQLWFHRGLWFLQLCFVLGLRGFQVCYGWQIAVSQTSVTPASCFQGNTCSCMTLLSPLSDSPTWHFMYSLLHREKVGEWFWGSFENELSQTGICILW